MELYEKALGLFNSHMHTDYTVENPRLVLIDDSCVVRKRNKAIRDMHAHMKQSRNRKGIYGEAIVGMDGDMVSGQAVILYHEDQDDALFVLLHELGHVFALSREADGHWFYDGIDENNTPLMSGYLIWKEFIADYIALNCLEEPLFPLADYKPTQEQKRTLLEADQENHDFLASYLAEVARAGVKEGIPFERTLKAVKRKVDREEYWRIDRERLEEIGNALLVDKAMLTLELLHGK